jgi:peptidoglycan/xylan/chitin deacetylase (PgdA/CDA1 family)
MKTVALLYHDVVDSTDWSSSGFPGEDAHIYKLPSSLFRDHLRGIREANPKTILTFDDGGVSALERTADLLEAEGFHGLFFIATDWIGKPGFLNATQILELRQRGHLIGAHSCSHPARFSYLSWGEMIREWSQSAARLADILGESVSAGSVPGGFYSKKVAQAAAEAGLSTLFTSEPTMGIQRVRQCVVVGRYSIQRGTSAQAAASLARADFLPRSAQSLLWNGKKVAKACGGTTWLAFRRWLIARRNEAAL